MNECAGNASKIGCASINNRKEQRQENEGTHGRRLVKILKNGSKVGRKTKQACRPELDSMSKKGVHGPE